MKYRNPHDNSPGAKRKSPLGPGPAVMAPWLGTGRAPGGTPEANTAVHGRGHGAGKRKASAAWGQLQAAEHPTRGQRTGGDGRRAMGVPPPRNAGP